MVPVLSLLQGSLRALLRKTFLIFLISFFTSWQGSHQLYPRRGRLSREEIQVTRCFVLKKKTLILIQLFSRVGVGVTSPINFRGTDIDAG